MLEMRPKIFEVVQIGSMGSGGIGWGCRCQTRPKCAGELFRVVGIAPGVLTTQTLKN